MRTGVVFPQTEIGADPVAVRDFAQAAESHGYDHLLVYDHVLGANPASRPAWRGEALTGTQTCSTSRSCCSGTWLASLGDWS